MSKPIGMYIHIPFCGRKCPYCDFYSVTDFSRIDKYTAAVCRNLTVYSNLTFDTVYFGGGTPSVIPAEKFGEMLRCIKTAENAEITVEVNPESATPDFLQKLFEVGVNRLSVGVQSLFDDELKILGRLHNSEKAAETINFAKAAGFENITADLILAVPSQTEERIAEEISRLAELGAVHLSAYLLKIEKGTPFSENTPESLPDDDRAADLYLYAVEEAEKHGFLQYEISNFAKPGFESRHNTLYWECAEYIGIGTAAHSYFCGKRFAVPRDIEAFIAAEKQPTYITDENPGSEEEKIMLALRLTEKGIPYTEKADKFIKAGLMRKIGDNAALTPKGCLVSNLIIGDFCGAGEEKKER
ncbi:MAG: radical SAM family heme chaperone HemW [Ruminococcus sp.]|nr:radical SAM family heme chaperone HemW [Ruminococcus sp.]